MDAMLLVHGKVHLSRLGHEDAVLLKAAVTRRAAVNLYGVEER
jgi:hypothetical protein